MKSEIIVAGMGPGPVSYLTQEAREILLSEKEIYFRVADHPVYHWLRGQGKQCVSFDPIYALPGMTYDKVYKTIVKTLVKAAQKTGRVVYALPGNPVVFEKTPFWLGEEAAGKGVSVRIVLGLSFLEVLYRELKIDPEAGLQILNGFNFGFYGDYPFTEKLGLLIGQVGFPSTKNPSGGDNNAGAIMRALQRKFPAGHRVTLAWSIGMPEFKIRTRTFPLGKLPAQSGYVRSLASLYVPPIRPPWEWVNKKAETNGRKTKTPSAKSAAKTPRKK
jgi:tetrapyrrole methylase family protein/MazG family protein